MNTPNFFGYNVGEDPQDFLDEVYKIVHAIGMTSREKTELASYQMKDIGQVWFTQSKYSQTVESGKSLRKHS